MSRRQQAERMAEWFEGRHIPDDIEFSPGQTIRNPAKFMERHLSALKTIPTGSRNWKAHYMRLYHLKKFLENKNQIQ